MEEALYDTPMSREKVQATVNATQTSMGRLLKSGTVVDATLIAAPCVINDSIGEHDPAINQIKKGNQWHFGMKAHIGVHADPGLLHMELDTAANVNGVPQAHALVHGEEADVMADTGFQDVSERDGTQVIQVDGPVPMRPGKREVLDNSRPMGEILDQLEQVKAHIRAKDEHPFRFIKRQFGQVKAL